jgi:hypothetical protein
MARTGRPKAELVVDECDREQLLRWSRRASSAQSVALRSKIILGCADGLDNKAVAARRGCAQATVGKWRARFIDSGLDGLSDDPRPHVTGFPVSDYYDGSATSAAAEPTTRRPATWSG